MARRTVLIVNDLTGKPQPEEELKTIEFTHPVTGTVYVLLTTDEDMAAFTEKISKEATKMANVTQSTHEAYEEKRKAALAIYNAAMEEAGREKTAALENFGAPLSALIAKTAKGFDDWEEKKRPGRAASGTGDPKRAADIAIGKARAAFINSEQALELGGKGMVPFIKARRSKPKGRMSETLTDWIMSDNIRPVWWPEGIEYQPTLV